MPTRHRRGSRCRRRLALALPGLVACAFAAAPAAASTIDVVIQNLQYTGQNITIKLGDQVRWTNLDNVSHTVTEGFVHPPNGSEAFNHTLSPGSAPFRVTFDAAFLGAHPMPGNRYNYFCVFHGTGMIGSVTVDDGPGSLYCFCDASPACLILDYGAGCPNSTFNGGRMRGMGSASVAADDLLLFVDQLPHNKSALVLRGTAEVPPAVFFDGYLCTGGSLHRFAAQSSGTSGAFVQGPGIVASTLASSAPITAGQTWDFQCYYRDVQSLCNHQVNISNGYSVTFVP
jgi:plastocyanin